MADTNFGTNHPTATKLWSRRVFDQAISQTYIKDLMGNSADAPIQVMPDLQKSAGDRVRVQLIPNLSQAGVAGDAYAEGNEEGLSAYTDDLLIDQLRFQVSTGGRMTRQRVPFDVREQCQMQLSKLWADRIDQAVFNQLAGKVYDGSTIIAADNRFTGSNAVVTSDSSHVVYSVSGVTTEASVNAKSASAVMTLQTIDYCVEKAKTLSTIIRPVRMKGQDYYVMFLHPNQVTDLRAGTASAGSWTDIQKAAMMGGQVTNNPIFTGALGVYNNVILKETPRVPIGGTSASPLTNVRLGIFMGAQAACIGFGKAYGGMKMNWVEKTFDYGNQLGVSAGLIWGVSKTIFNSTNYSVITVPTYAAAHGA